MIRSASVILHFASVKQIRANSRQLKHLVAIRCCLKRHSRKHGVREEGMWDSARNSKQPRGQSNQVFEGAGGSQRPDMCCPCGNLTGDVSAPAATSSIISARYLPRRGSLIFANRTWFAPCTQPRRRMPCFSQANTRVGNSSMFTDNTQPCETRSSLSLYRSRTCLDPAA